MQIHYDTALVTRIPHAGRTLCPSSSTTRSRHLRKQIEIIPQYGLFRVMAPLPWAAVPFFLCKLPPFPLVYHEKLPLSLFLHLMIASPKFVTREVTVSCSRTSPIYQLQQNHQQQLWMGNSPILPYNTWRIETAPSLNNKCPNSENGLLGKNMFCIITFPRKLHAPSRKTIALYKQTAQKHHIFPLQHSQLLNDASPL